jgi:hypothetical protein
MALWAFKAPALVLVFADHFDYETSVGWCYWEERARRILGAAVGGGGFPALVVMNTGGADLPFFR